MVDIRLNGEILKDIKLMIFDRDGTLIDLYHYWSKMIRRRAELICEKFGLGEEHKVRLMFEMGVDLKKKKLRPEGPVGIKKREIVMQAAIDYLDAVGIKNSYSTCFEVFKDVDRLSELNMGDLIKPLAGLYELFDALSVNDCRIAIATTDRTERAKLSMDFLKLLKRLDYVIGADGVKRAKPAPDMINLVLDNLKIDRLNVVMVGDAATDIQMGVNAGVKASIAVCSGITPKDQLSRLTDYVVDDISKIEILGRSYDEKNKSIKKKN